MPAAPAPTAASRAGALDVYVTAPGASLAAIRTPSFTVGASGLAQSTTFLSFAPGTYEVRVTASGNKADLRMDLPAVTLGDQQPAAVVLTPTIGGALVDAGVVVERGAYSADYNGQSRVRLVSGVPGGTVSAAGAGTVIEAGAASPTVGAYVTVPAGSVSPAVRVGGAAAAVPPITPVAGSDNTLLVTGTAGAAQATLLADDSHLPAVSGNAGIRFVNGPADGGASLSTAVDFASVASNLAPGGAGAHAHARVAGDSATRIELDSPLSTTPLSLQTGLDIPGGGVYKLFVLGDTAAPGTRLRRDR